LDAERKEKELLAQEQKNIDMKLKVIEEKQLHCFEEAKRAEVCNTVYVQIFERRNFCCFCG